MRLGPVVVVCSLLLLAGCGGGSSSSAPAIQPPVANAGGPYTGAAGTAVSFSGAASTDPQGETLTYAWNFGDSGTGTGVSPTHTYAAAGTYTVTLTVTNTSNLTATATSKATIAAQPPVANAGGPYTGVDGVALSFSGAASTDPQGETLTYAWNFGDSSTGTGVSPTHTYSTIGTYTVTLTVTNTSNLTSTATVKVIVPNGRVYGGQQPVAGAHVYLFAANTTGYGQASVSLLSAASTGQSDSVGAYVLTGADGSFFTAGDYSCTPGSQVYLYSLGGSAGSGTNTGIGLLAALGAMPERGKLCGDSVCHDERGVDDCSGVCLCGFRHGCDTCVQLRNGAGAGGCGECVCQRGEPGDALDRYGAFDDSGGEWDGAADGD